jgi:formylglycine-generating enzyme required for sulfatase activity
MGSPESEMGRLADELEHPVTLTHDVWLQETEITQAQFEELMGYNPAHYGPQGTGADCGPDCPVESVSWHELAAYSNELSRAEGLAECYSCAGAAPDYECEPADQETGPYECPGYRLPTEAEWEYAVRAGDRRATYNGDVATIDCISSPALDPIAWHCANSLATTHPVAKKEPNQWGLFDMLGNVYEWCHDWYGAYPGGPATNPDGAASGTERVIRGGSCLGNARWARAAHRDSSSPDLRAWALGGRVARSQL